MSSSSRYPPEHTEIPGVNFLLGTSVLAATTGVNYSILVAGERWDFGGAEAPC